jgi:undecaprenyl-diphosphatase
MYLASFLGDHSVLWAGLAVGEGVLAGQLSRRTARVLAALALESIAVNLIIKPVFARRRPAHDDLRPFRVRQPLTSSFPSGHASSGFCAVELLANSPGERALLSAAALAVAWSRCHVGLHHLSDVLGGAAVGTLIGRILRTGLVDR